MNRRQLLFVAAVAALARRAFAIDATRISIQVASGKVVGGPKVIRLKRNAFVVLTVVADTADELHVHGYNLQLKLLPNKPISLKFSATHTGPFTFELHKAHTDLGALEVYPE